MAARQRERPDRSRCATNPAPLRPSRPRRATSPTPTSPRLVQAVVDAFGGLDILVTDGSGPPGGTFTAVTLADWQRGVESTLPSAVRLVHATLPRLERSRAIPLGRMGQPEEFGRPAAFMVSPAASYLTGAMIQLDGGAYAGLL